MPPQVIDAALKEKLLSTAFRPAITMWNRLEGRARREEFNRSLRAEVRDPLWMLTRQWQLGEFKGEDAGSAAKVRVQIDAARLDRFAVKARDPRRPAHGRMHCISHRGTVSASPRRSAG